MRTIKFRAWLIKECKMVIPATINYNEGYGDALEIFVDNPEFDLFENVIENKESDVLPFFTYINHSLEVHKKGNNGDDFILEQFTGLKDKNGKEIYEGDIVIAWSEGLKRTVMVKWRQEGLPAWILYPAYEDGKFWKLHGTRHRKKGYWYDNVEIIGNIHENPELLK